VKYATIFGIGILAFILVAESAVGQRVQFPSKLHLNSAQPVSSSQATWAPNYGPVAQNGTTVPAPSTGSYTYPGATTTPPPSLSSPPPASTYTGNSTYTPQPPGYPSSTYTYPPGQVPSYAPTGPTATFQGGISAPPPTGWDPYAVPGPQQPGLMPYDPTCPPPPTWQFQDPSTYVETMQRFMHVLRFDYYWIPGSGAGDLGIHDADISATFAIPLRNPRTPLMITPGFAASWWDGPSPAPPDPVFPPRLYAAYLQTAWNPQLTDEFGGDLAFRVGVYSDFKDIKEESLRYQGMGYFRLALSPSWELKAGVQYLDRQRIKLLPAGGLIWTPNTDVRFELLFPDPKLAWRLPNHYDADWWIYTRAAYGGDSWTITTPGNVIETDYNDYRVAVGLEFDNPNRIDGYFEVGYAFKREIYQFDAIQTEPKSSIFLGAGLAY